MFTPPVCVQMIKQVRTFQDVSFHARADGDTNKHTFIIREELPSGACGEPRRINPTVNLHVKLFRLSFKAPARQVDTFLFCKYTWNLFKNCPFTVLISAKVQVIK